MRMLNIFMLLLLGANSGVVFADCAGAAKSGDFALARSLCPPVADQQPPDVSWLIGYWYERGEGGPVDYRKAAFWYKKAADRGSSAGKVDLGKLHLRNKGGLTDFKAGIELVKGEIRVGKNNSKEYELLYNALLFGEPGTGKYVDYDEAIRYGRLLLKTNPETEKVLQDQMRIKLSIAALLASGKVKDADGARQARAIFKEVAEWQIAKLGSGQGRIYCDSQCNLLLKYWVIALEKGLGASPAPDAARQFYEKYTIQTDSLLNTRYQGQGKRSNWQLYEQLLRPARSFIPLDVVRKELNAPDSTQLVLFPTKSWTGIDSAFDLTVFSGYDWRLEDLETIINNANQVVASCGIGIRRATIFQGRFDGLSDPDSFYTAEHDVWSNQYRFPAKGVGATAIFSNTEKTTDGGWSKQNRHDPQEIHLAVINHKESDDAINDFDLAHELGHLLGDFGHSDDFTPSVMQYIPSIRNFRFLPEQCEKIRVHPDVYPIARGWAPPATPSNVPHEIVNELALWPIGKTTLTESLGGRDRKSADTLAKTIKSYVMTSGDLRPLTYLKDYYLPESPRVAVFYDILGRMTTETRGAIQGPVLEGIAKEYFLGTGDVLQIVAQARAWQPDYGWPTEKILANKEGWANVPAIALLRFEETDSSDYFKVDARGCNPLLNYEDPDDVKKSFTSSLIRYVRGCSSRQSFEIRKMQNVLSELENRSQLGLWYGLGFKRAYQMYCQGAQRGSEEARNMVSLLKISCGKEEANSTVKQTSGEIDVTKLSYSDVYSLLERNLGITPLMIYADRGDVNSVRKLISASAYINKVSKINTSALMLASNNGHHDVVDLLIKNGAMAPGNASNDLLFKAVKNGDLETCKKLIKVGASVKSVDKDGYTALHYVPGNNVELAKLLVEAGAAINGADNNKKTPLANIIMNATTTKDIEVVRYLIGIGADVELAPKPSTKPIFQVLFSNNPQPELVKLLLSKGARLDYTNKSGKTVLQESRDFLEYLKNEEKGKDKTKINNMVEIVNLLEHAGH